MRSNFQEKWKLAGIRVISALALGMASGIAVGAVEGGGTIFGCGHGAGCALGCGEAGGARGQTAGLFTESGGLAIPESWTGRKVSLWGFSPHFSAQGVAGTSSVNPSELAVGHHDPRRNGFSVTNLEAGCRFKRGIVGGNVTGAWTENGAGSFDSELEEAFLTLQWPEAFEWRAGKFYNRFGIQNSFHPHAFEWVDQYLANGRLLGEDSLATVGGELNWTLPLEYTSVLTLSLGVAPDNAGHDHGDHGAHAGYEVEEAMFKNAFVTLNWTNQNDYNDFHQFRYGCSGAWGQNRSNRATGIYGVHGQYQWRENGYEAGGDSFRVTAEAYMKNWSQRAGEAGHEHEEHEEHEGEAGVKSFLAGGYYISAVYNWQNTWEAGLRVGTVSGAGGTEWEARTRLSPGVTWYANPERTLALRLQYNLDFIDGGTENSVWFQTSLAWGD